MATQPKIGKNQLMENENKNTLPTQQALHHANEDILKNESLPNEVINIILSYIITTNLIESGMIFFGRVTQEEDYDDFAVSYLFLLTKMTNIKFDDKVSYIMKSSEFDVIFIIPDQSCITIGNGYMELIDNGCFNEYNMTMDEYAYHLQTQDRDTNLPSKLNLTMQLPSYDEDGSDIDSKCKWHNWDEYKNRIKIFGIWYHDSDKIAERANGKVCAYLINKWCGQTYVEQYIGIDQLKDIPNITKNTSVESAITKIQDIVVRLN